MVLCTRASRDNELDALCFGRAAIIRPGASPPDDTNTLKPFRNLVDALVANDPLLEPHVRTLVVDMHSNGWCVFYKQLLIWMLTNVLVQYRCGDVKTSR